MLHFPPAVASDFRGQTALHDKAVELESVFLSEMLAHSGLDRGLSPGTGDDGPDPFASFLRERLAEQIARAGGIGLSEAIFRSMASEAGDAFKE